MKIKIQKDFVRLRLKRSEVVALDQSGIAKSAIKFGDNSLVYQLVTSEELKDVMARIEKNCITMEIPGSIVNEWTLTDKVSFENTNQDEIRILVEKDFKCIHQKPGIDDSYNYSNPKAKL